MKTIFNRSIEDAATKNRNAQRKLKIIQFISQQGEPTTIHQICRQLDVSIPTGIKLMNELLDEGFIKVVGKKENPNGRKPQLYALNDPNFFAIAVEISIKRISVALVDPGLNIVKYRQKIDFELENTQECLQQVISFVRQCLKSCNVKEDMVLGMGVGITGRVNTEQGKSITYFNFLEKSLAAHLSELFGTPVFVENDTRCLGMAEKNLGRAMNVGSAVVINLSRGLGTALIVNGNLVSGAAGYAGEFGHMHFGGGDKMCLCGKVGCLGTMVGGHALEEQFLQAIADGQPSLLAPKADGVRYDNILDAALQGDQLSIRLVQQMGRTLGYALGNIVNLLNPELVVLGGKFARLGSIMLDPIRAGMAESALINPLKMCRLEVSNLGDMALLKGVGALVFEHFELLQNRTTEAQIYI